ncbi:MAG: hypothetical protein J6K04_03145 [Lachnospiraceae bacterium]|nr:hypothetical protein [Lachnospiraceae bacterium]
MKQEENMKLASTESMRISLEAVRTGKAGLNRHRRTLLERVPKSGDWARFPRESITTKDIAYLSAATKHEFALLRGKKEDVLFHGVELECTFNDELMNLLKTHKFELVAHTHPDWVIITPSQNDRNFLRNINQEKSVIISYITGVELEFSSNVYEDIYKEVWPIC